MQLGLQCVDGILFLLNLRYRTEYSINPQAYSSLLYRADTEPPGDTLELVASAIGLVAGSGLSLPLQSTK